MNCLNSTSEYSLQKENENLDLTMASHEEEVHKHLKLVFDGSQVMIIHLQYAADFH